MVGVLLAPLARMPVDCEPARPPLRTPMPERTPRTGALQAVPAVSSAP